METITYTYKPKPIIMLLAILFFVVCAAILGNMALNNNQGLILNGIISMGSLSATIFYTVLTIASGLFVLFGTIGLIKGFRKGKEVMVTDSYISAPLNGFAKQVVTINYTDILAIDTQQISGQHLFNIHHINGKLSIPRSMLPNKQAYEAIIDRVALSLQSDINV